MITDATLGATVFQTPINFAAAGNNIIIPGTFGLRTKILQFWYILAGATNLTFYSGLTPLTGTMIFPGAGAHVQDYMQLPINCLPGDNFIINSSTAQMCGGIVWYIKQ